MNWRNRYRGPHVGSRIELVVDISTFNYKKGDTFTIVEIIDRDYHNIGANHYIFRNEFKVIG